MSKKIKTKEQKKTRNDLILRIASAAIVFLMITLLVLLTIQFKVVERVSDLLDREDPIVIEGECYLFFDKIFYQIKDGNDCRKECTNECLIRDKDYSNSEFVLTPDSCNLCNCHCS